MIDPTQLSPAAQKVKDAVLATYADNIPKDKYLWALERASTVASLRAAAYEIDWESGDSKFLLENVATELENAQ